MFNKIPVSDYLNYEWMLEYSTTDSSIQMNIRKLKYRFEYSNIQTNIWWFVTSLVLIYWYAYFVLVTIQTGNLWAFKLLTCLHNIVWWYYNHVLFKPADCQLAVLKSFLINTC